jgi:hypothetical protein
MNGVRCIVTIFGALGAWLVALSPVSATDLDQLAAPKSGWEVSLSENGRFGKNGLDVVQHGPVMGVTLT